MKIKQQFNQVKNLLTIHEKFRDNDNLLLSKFWEVELHKQGVSKKEFFFYLEQGWLSSPESITRARRKVQELHPELRGKRYGQRKVESQAETKQEVKDLSNPLIQKAVEEATEESMQGSLFHEYH